MVERRTRATGREILSHRLCPLALQLQVSMGSTGCSRVLHLLSIVHQSTCLQAAFCSMQAHVLESGYSQAMPDLAASVSTMCALALTCL